MSAQTQTMALSGSRKRWLKDRLAQAGVTAGGIVVLVALLLIFFYLLYVVKPIFDGASVEPVGEFALDGDGAPLVLGVEEQNEQAYTFSEDGTVHFYSLLEQGRVLSSVSVEGEITTAAASDSKPMAAYGLSDGSMRVLAPKFDVSYPDNVRTITPGLTYPFGSSPLQVDEQGRALEQLSFATNGEDLLVAAVVAGGDIVLTRFSGKENFLTGELELSPTQVAIPGLPARVEQVLVTPNLRFMFVRSGNEVSVYDVRNINKLRLRSVIPMNARGGNISAMTLLAGGNSLLVGNDNGVVSQWFEVAKDGKREFTFIREFEASGPVAHIANEINRKGFVTVSTQGEVDIFHTTGNSHLFSEKLAGEGVSALSFSPRNNLLLVAEQGRLSTFEVDNEHPEVTWKAMWTKVWYEGYPEPQYVWQSTSGSSDFEAKLSLVPISFGTIKAAFYALLFAVPIAIAGAVYTAYFMSPGLRKVVKPTVEIMEALPTVILGFLAGLWLAPLIETHLPGVVMVLVLMPAGVLLTAFIWHHLPKHIKNAVPDGWQSLLLLPVVLLVGWACFAFSPAVESAFFGGDARGFLTNELGIGFDQRNSLVVGIAMGFAVIPTIFSIAEDAVFSVPRHLTNGSLALGATPWQTLTRVVMLTASPGIFSAVMMGLGRAVGETMIVLMATGNTPVMDFSIFNGMRTLAANIAVEMPEAEVNSSHYRVLFLAAFVLFVFTFLFNTVAEFVRQRLRDKYSSL
ncbi:MULTISPECIES: ABC transporter permease subunit [Oceanimonas]|uniref:Phosphate ABC transporter permease n=1 Tax=Oceanimonas doudoroffii TaxID=84158 RepID=A0A233REM8_9GAMM|nr:MULTISPECIES: ABC transporter permease subunit [Oceanimonas]NHI01349.1 Phosphate transport system permease protein PstC 1 [Oceanimonas sp. MB9]OXY81839.1 phosphate ABC transporter permease [Oceanimonas doudoroffii]